MKQHVTFTNFADAFKASKRENFSYDGLCVLFDFLEEWENDCGEEMELDVIELCCDFFEYENLAEFNKENGTDYISIVQVRDITDVIEIGNSGGFIVRVF